jgi:hypothetical protein
MPEPDDDCVMYISGGNEAVMRICHPAAENKERNICKLVIRWLPSHTSKGLSQ